MKLSKPRLMSILTKLGLRPSDGSNNANETERTKLLKAWAEYSRDDTNQTPQPEDLGTPAEYTHGLGALRSGNRPEPGSLSVRGSLLARLSNRSRWPRKWCWPEFVPLDLSPQDWKTQHDEISKAINRLVIVVIGFSFFCALALGAPDRNLLASDAKVGLPFANTEISYVYFLFIGPIVLVALSFYLLVFVGYWLSLSQSRQITVENPTHLPFMFNLGSKTAKYISYFLFYWLVPSVLMLFAWKALPRPESNVLVAVTSSFVVIFVFLQLRRRSAILSYLHLRRRFAHVYVFCLWLVLFVGLFVSVRSSWAFLLSRSNENVFTRTLHLR